MKLAATRLAAGAFLALTAGAGAGCTTKTVYVHSTVTASPAATPSQTQVGNVSPNSGYPNPSAPGTYSPSQPAAETPTLDSSCVVISTDPGNANYGWTITFTNNSATDITVGLYTAVFFGSGGSETGSASAVNTPFIVAAGQSYTDTENHSGLAPVPAGSVTCRLSTWTAG